MTTLDPTNAEERALVRLLRSTIDEACYPLAPRYDPLRTILAMLEPPPPQPERCRPSRRPARRRPMGVTGVGMMKAQPQFGRSGANGQGQVGRGRLRRGPPGST